MKSISLLFVSGLFLFGTLWGGWLQARISQRGRASQALQTAADRLKQPLPGQLGNWRLVNEQTFDDSVIGVLECPAYLCRTYRNDQTSDIVNVAVTIGPPGPIAVHTPELCYSSRDFQFVGERTETRIQDQSGREHMLWELTMKSNNVQGAAQRVLYGWGTGGAWLATKNPRFAHAGAPYLYKIQLAAAISADAEEFDPCQDFLAVFLPQLQKRLVPQDGPASAPPQSPRS